MIFGRRDEISICGSYVLPSEDGSYVVPPATVIETFWAYRSSLSDDDMILKYKVVDPTTFAIIEFADGVVAKCVTANMIGRWIPTKFHPDFMGGWQQVQSLFRQI